MFFGLVADCYRVAMRVTSEWLNEMKSVTHQPLHGDCVDKTIRIAVSEWMNVPEWFKGPRRGSCLLLRPTLTFPLSPRRATIEDISDLCFLAIVFRGIGPRYKVAITGRCNRVNRLDIASASCSSLSKLVIFAAVVYCYFLDEGPYQNTSLAWLALRRSQRLSNWVRWQVPVRKQESSRQYR